MNYQKQPYGEIRSNVLAKNFYPIDILRLKLSFFGAVKFDPKSDRWLRITLFQGAPLLDTAGLSKKMIIGFYIFMKMIKISSNELENSIYKAAESHFFAEGFCVSSMKTIGYLEAIGLPVIETFLQFLKNSARAYPKLKIVETTDNNLEINFQNTSCIYYAESIANFILENSRKKIFF